MRITNLLLTLRTQRKVLIGLESRQNLIILFLVFLMVGACTSKNASTSTVDKTSLADTLNYFAENGFGKPVSTLQHPAGEYYNGVTFLAYQGPHEDPFVCAYNHSTKEWMGPVKAGTSALGRTPASTDHDEIDNHGRPAMIIDGLGYIHLVFGGHGGNKELGTNNFGLAGRGHQMHVVSKDPGDISSWEILDNISPFGTYSQFVKKSDGTIYLFYRHGSHRSDWVYQKSMDNGRTFSDPVSILKTKQQISDPTIHDSWYVWFAEGPDNMVSVSFNYHPCANPKHSSLRVNTYAMMMDLSNDSWKNLAGASLTLPLTKESADRLVQVFDSSGEKTRLGTNHVDNEGNPHLYFRYDSDSSSIIYHRWTGQQWVTTGIKDPSSKLDDGDFLFDSNGQIKFLLSQNNKVSESLNWWSSSDNGLNWNKDQPILSGSKVNLVMTAFLRNAHPDARVIAAEIPTDPISVESKLYLLGDSGPVKRIKY